MCRVPTPTDKHVLCGRCFKVANPNDGWEHGWPLTGRVSLGYPSCAFHYLAKRAPRKADDPMHHEAWRVGHPAMKKNEAQFVEFDWSYTSAYRLCYDCQGELLAVVGEFFGYGDPSREAKWLAAKAELAARIAKEAADRAAELAVAAVRET